VNNSLSLNIKLNNSLLLPTCWWLWLPGKRGMIDGEGRGEEDECECEGKCRSEDSLTGVGDGVGVGVGVAVGIGDGVGCNGLISGFCFCTWMANAYIIFLINSPSTTTSSPMLIFPCLVWHSTSIWAEPSSIPSTILSGSISIRLIIPIIRTSAWK